MTELANLRTDYDLDELSETVLPSDPMALFDNWLQRAIDIMGPEATAMALATAVDGQPAARIVLLKGLDRGGFVFFGNYASRKGRELACNPLASLTFFWPQLQRQVRVEGRVHQISGAESDAYFATRPRESQLGAWASPQSTAIAGRAELEQSLALVSQRFAGQPVARPDHWGGWRLMPAALEFWQGRPSRLHDRLCAALGTQNWQWTRLAP